MASYRVFVGNRKYDVTVEKDSLQVDGTEYSYDMESINGNGLHILRHPDRHVEAYLEDRNSGSYQVQIQGQHLNAEVELGFRSAASKVKAALGQVSAPMPGVIIDLQVEVGDPVLEGETLLIQEAMKMQMKIKSPSSGTVQKLTVQPGDQVDKGAPLILISPTK